MSAEGGGRGRHDEGGRHRAGRQDQLRAVCHHDDRRVKMKFLFKKQYRVVQKKCPLIENYGPQRCQGK